MDTSLANGEVAAAAEIAREAFGLDLGGPGEPRSARVQALPGDQDRNFRVEDARGEVYLLRLFVSGTPRATISFLRDLTDHACAARPELAARLQRFVGEGERIQSVRWDGRDVDACLLTFLPGQLLSRVHPHSPELIEDFGRVLGQLATALADFQGRPVEFAPQGDVRGPSWTLLDAPEEILPRLHFIENKARRGLVEAVLDRHVDTVEAAVERLRCAVVHQDANENNLLVEATTAGSRVTGLIDFGDACYTALVAEPAIAAAYVAFDKKDPLTAMARLVAGFHAEFPLTDEEFDCVFDLARLRLAMSVAVSSERAAGDDVDPYHLVSAAPAWRVLEQLERVHPRYATAVFREAAGLAPLGDATERFRTWAELHRADFAPVLGTALEEAPRVDLSIDSPLLLADPTDAGLDVSMAEWGGRVEAIRRASGAAAAAGYHDETRLLYDTEAFSENREDGPEPRTIHLGVDLFGPAGTRVFAPLEGTVLSVQRNDFALDYGPTVILEHEPEDGPAFATLYGHLDGEVLKRLQPGARVFPGDLIGEFGGEHENGGWPPHLHFQVYLDRFEEAGNLPGVASPRRRRVWTAISPDPAPLLGLDSCAAEEPRTEDVLSERRARFCTSMSISYDRPVQMVKGRGTTLFDAEGHAFLDAVNNVPHVGHCHPHVVAVGARQMALLNTNTRYLNETLLRYADKLRAKLPPHLEVIYFVCSGSEANEVALRLATAATDGATETLVQEHGYHGHTGATVARSHYKFAGSGGFAPPGDVHVIPIADPFRGVHRGADSGPKYVAEVEAILERLAAEGRRPRAILAEAIIGCGGQVVPPAGYLAGAFDAVRAAGGVAIADEVQVGFGRVGSHFWAFEEQGARPDIVTMGKPMGNGHPIAAVATTREIAERFAGGMEFFATFGGNNVSVAIGEAVLDVIEAEGLQENAERVGARFFARMEPMAERYPWIGDVRGRGLYLGVDLVKDQETREPDGAAARYVAGRMRDKGILISTDGPHHNVLKIKPPIVFSVAEMDRLVEALGDVLGETAVQRTA
ncbi:2,2-dialkylglycine decarboxylase [Planctomycetes bacterium Poly30]|uniref:2,2-dialkylglycine decarboxylase n=1 Tax=Saltatorellus ferox TaxID=2528018 RepID=A0A518ENR1_9BACT|nr:2,2-dialkylglycine decarboxylase [Planctomycetes bacterium Poly30]